MKSLWVKLGLLLLIAEFTMFSFSEVLGEERYICFPDHRTGFKYDASSKNWEQANFKSDHKYIISKSDDKRFTFEVKETGKNFPTFSCKEGFNEHGYLMCQGIGEFKFNKKNGRYILTFSVGYYNVLPDTDFSTDEKSDTPYIEIGKCSPF